MNKKHKISTIEEHHPANNKIYSKFLNKSYLSSAIMKATSIYSIDVLPHTHNTSYGNAKRLKCQTNLACARDHSPKTHKTHDFLALHTQYTFFKDFISLCAYRESASSVALYVWYNGTEKALAVIDSLSFLKLNLTVQELPVIEEETFFF